MALDEDIRRIMGFDQGPDNNAEITFKIKPLGSVSANPAVSSLSAATQVGVPSEPATVGGGDTGGGGTSPPSPPSPSVPTTPTTPITGAPTVPAQQTTPTGFPTTGQGLGPEGQSIVPQNQRIKLANPQLVTHPLGARTDDIYEAAIAQQQFDAQSQYFNLLRDLGWMDEAGNFIPGLLETEAVRRRGDLQFDREAAIRNVTEGAVRGGTVFSGRRAFNQSQAQRPFDAALANLETVLGRELGMRYAGLSDVTRQFELNRNQLIAEAAARFAAQQQGGPAAPPGGPSEPGTEPPAGPPGAPPAPPPPPAEFSPEWWSGLGLMYGEQPGPSQGQRRRGVQV